MERLFVCRTSSEPSHQKYRMPVMHLLETAPYFQAIFSYALIRNDLSTLHCLTNIKVVATDQRQRHLLYFLRKHWIRDDLMSIIGFHIDFIRKK